jgi:hypothetical protein
MGINRHSKNLRAFILVYRLCIYLLTLKHLESIPSILRDRNEKEKNSLPYDQARNLTEEADEQGQVIGDYIYLGSLPIVKELGSNLKNTF